MVLFKLKMCTKLQNSTYGNVFHFQHQPYMWW